MIAHDLKDNRYARLMVNLYSYLAHQRRVMLERIAETPWYYRWWVRRRMKHSLACLTSTLQLFPAEFGMAHQQIQAMAGPQLSDSSAADKLMEDN